MWDTADSIAGSGWDTAPAPEPAPHVVNASSSWDTTPAPGPAPPATIAAPEVAASKALNEPATAKDFGDSANGLGKVDSSTSYGVGVDTVDGGATFGGGDDTLNDSTCYNCGEKGHMKSECTNPQVAREDTRPCFNCGEVGHNKASCTNPAVEREFTGECRSCGQSGHRASDCPDAPPRSCKNCGEEGHNVVDCKNRRLINRDHVADVKPDVSWEELKAAIADKDLDDVNEAIEKYVKALPDTTYVDLETAFREQKLGLYIMALDRELLITYTNMDLQGNLNKKYKASFRFSDKPKRVKESEGWPESAEENMERLKDAGEPVDCGMSKCHNCNLLGHSSKFCKEEKIDPPEAIVVKCFNCDEVGHRVRDCPIPRKDKFACRNCSKSGHSAKDCPEPRSAEGVECKKCSEMGHFAKDCPTGGGGGGGGCRNCGQEGHFAKDCTEPRDNSKSVCTNCDEVGHWWKECTKKRDYSRIKCTVCSEMGHTKARCPQALGDTDGGDGQINSAGDAVDAFGSASLAAVPSGSGQDWDAGGTTAPSW